MRMLPMQRVANATSRGRAKKESAQYLTLGLLQIGMASITGTLACVNAYNIGHDPIARLVSATGPKAPQKK
jgi:hypothetical protein